MKIMLNGFVCNSEQNLQKQQFSSATQKKGILAAVCSAIVPGSGYLFTKRYLRAALYFVAMVISIFVFVFSFIDLIIGFATLGDTPMINGVPGDHSQLNLLFGFIAIIITGFMIAIYVVNIKGSYELYMEQFGVHYARLSFKDELKKFLTKQTPLLFLLPGIIAVAAVVLLPFLYSISIAFTNYDINHQPPRALFDWVGLANFRDLFVFGSYGATFFGILMWNLVFMVCTSVLPYAIGIFVALMLQSKGIRFKAFFRLIYILPWAIPGYLSTMMLKTMFMPSGPINQFVGLVFGESAKVGWLFQTMPARAAVIMVASWLGFSFPMMMSESILGSIPSDMYEAAKLDGANAIKIFFRITLPLLSFSIAPIFIMGLSGSFNNMNVIILLTGGAPMNMNYIGDAGDTDILMSWLYKLTMTKKQYNIAAAVSLILFVIIAIFSVFNLKKTKNFKEEDMLQ